MGAGHARPPQTRVAALAGGTGDVNTAVNLAVNGQVTLTLTATLAATATGDLVNTATVAPPAGTLDPNPANNSSTHTDAVLTSTLTGNVFLDGNNSVGQDAGEGLANITVIITTSVGTTLRVTTDSNGSLHGDRAGRSYQR